MFKMKIVTAELALLGLVSSIPSAAWATGAAQSGGGSASDALQCRVVVSRSASAGVFDVTRQVLKTGRCVCRVSTGPRSQGGSAESLLAVLLERRSCAEAPLAAAGAGGSGGLGPLLVPLGALGAAGGTAAAVTGGGPASP